MTKRGRPKKIKSEIDKLREKSQYNLSPSDRRKTLGLQFLEMVNVDLNKEQTKQYLNLLIETPEGEFSGTGWNIYRNILHLVF